MSFSDLPLRRERVGLFLELGEILFEPLQPILGAGVALLFQRLLLDLEPHDLAIEIVELFGLGIDLHAQPRRRLVDKVDGLVGQEAVGDVAVRQRRRRHQSGVGDFHLVVRLVLFLEAAQDRDGVLDARLVDIDRLEAARQCGVLLDVLAILVERGGADAMQFAARQGGLEQVRRIHRAVGFAGADDGVHLVDEENVGAGRSRHLLQHGFEPLLELAAIFRAGDHRAHVEREQLLVLQAFRHVAVDDAQRQAFDDRGLADAGLADEHGIIFRPARQHLNGAADFLVAADDRIELAVARGLREVAGIFLQRVVGILGRRRIRGAALAQGLDGGIERLRRDAGGGENFPRLAALFEREREQKPLDGDVAVAGLLARFLSGVEHPRQSRIEIDLAGPTAGDFRALIERRFDGGERLAGIAAGAVDEARGEPFGVVEQHLQEVLGRELLVTLALGKGLGGLHETAAAVGVFLEIHGQNSLGLSRTPQSMIPKSSFRFSEKIMPQKGADETSSLGLMALGCRCRDADQTDSDRRPRHQRTPEGDPPPSI